MRSGCGLPIKVFFFFKQLLDFLGTDEVITEPLLLFFYYLLVLLSALTQMFFRTFLSLWIYFNHHFLTLIQFFSADDTDLSIAVDVVSSIVPLCLDSDDCDSSADPRSHVQSASRTVGLLGGCLGLALFIVIAVVSYLVKDRAAKRRMMLKFNRISVKHVLETVANIRDDSREVLRMILNLLAKFCILFLNWATSTLSNRIKKLQILLKSTRIRHEK